ncbi:MAG: hypothetical protein MUE69_06835 [Myxococcota bacterium]|jgi:hypothetical protein|nr:hypothetical protein [Myxococcota bacterium]
MARRTNLIVIALCTTLVGSLGSVARADPRHPSDDAFPRPPVHLEHEGRLSLPTWVTWAGVAATAVLGTSMVWSFSKLSDARRMQDAAPSDEHERAFERHRRQTIGLGLGTGLAAIGTTLLAILATDWDGAELSASVSREGALVGVSRRF